ncbi:MAG: Anaerobic sulfite reductase subunit [Planctomycetota bacterium]|jgi:NAD(P)H-flavin reductase
MTTDSRSSCATPAADPWRQQPARIHRMLQELPGVTTFELVPESGIGGGGHGIWPFRAGQFNMLYLPGVGESAISISGDPARADVIPHTVRQAGNVTRGLAALREGDVIGLRGPFGSSWPLERCGGHDVVLVAGGIGLAPLRPAIYQLLANRAEYGELTLIMGAREPQLLLYPGEYDGWRAAGLNVVTTVDRADGSWHGSVGVVTSILDRLWLRDPSGTLVFTCGPEVMMWYVMRTAASRGVPADSLYLSLERNMNCAVAFCGHCQFGPWFLCREGPVLSFDRVQRLLRIENL